LQSYNNTVNSSCWYQLPLASAKRSSQTPTAIHRRSRLETHEMKRFLMAAAAVAAFASNGVAHAADMGLPIAPPVYVPPPAVLSWTGPYVGLNGGGGWGTTDHTFTGVVAGLTASTGNFKTSGGLAGGTWGYNYQVGAWVFGAESDLDWANIRGTFTAAIPGVVTGSLSTKLNWLSTYRARVGYTWGPAMLCHRRRGRRQRHRDRGRYRSGPAARQRLDLTEQHRGRLDRRRRL
jgi:hypothetical protein